MNTEYEIRVLEIDKEKLIKKKKLVILTFSYSSIFIF